MKKILTFFLFIPTAILVAGLFGVLHDQISYSVSNEYFTKFKFLQFHFLNPDVPERIRAAEVGFLASWWMGIPLGVLCGSAGFVQRSPALMRRALLWSLLVIAIFTLTIALTGLAYGWGHTRTIEYRELSRLVCSTRCGQPSPIPLRWLHAQFRLSWRSFIDSRGLALPFRFQSTQLELAHAD